MCGNLQPYPDSSWSIFLHRYPMSYFEVEGSMCGSEQRGECPKHVESPQISEPPPQEMARPSEFIPHRSPSLSLSYIGSAQVQLNLVRPRRVAPQHVSLHVKVWRFWQG